VSENMSVALKTYSLKKDRPSPSNQKKEEEENATSDPEKGGIQKVVTSRPSLQKGKERFFSDKAKSISHGKSLGKTGGAKRSSPKKGRFRPFTRKKKKEKKIAEGKRNCILASLRPSNGA